MRESDLRKLIRRTIFEVIQENTSMYEEEESKQQAERLGLKHVGWGRYADSSGKVTHKSVQGKLVPVSGDEDPNDETGQTFRDRHPPPKRPAGATPPAHWAQKQAGIEPPEEPGTTMGIHPQQKWHQNDPLKLLQYIYWLRSQLPPEDRKSAYRKIIQQLQQKHPADPETYKKHWNAFGD